MNKNLKSKKQPKKPKPPKDSKRSKKQEPNINDINNVSDVAVVNEYYQKVGLRIKLLRYLLIAFLIFFVVWSLVFRADEVTVGNVGQLLRYIDIAYAIRGGSREFRIEADDNFLFAYHRNNIVVLRRNRLDIYDVSGRRNASFPITYSFPILNVAQRHILIYDLGGRQLGVFNTNSRLFEYAGENPIFGARVNDRGFVVYITTQRGYRSVVKVLNQRFSEIFAVYRVRDYVMDADICNNAQYLVLAGYYAESGDILSTILIYRTDDGDPLAEITVRGERPFTINMNDAGFTVLFENSIRFYDFDGEEIGRYGFTGRTMHMVELSAEFSAVVLNEWTIGNEGRILIFDNSGDLVFNRAVDMQIIDMRFAENYDYLYFLTRQGIYRIGIGENAANTITIELFMPRLDEYGEPNYNETSQRIVLANDRNIILAGLSSVNILVVD